VLRTAWSELGAIDPKTLVDARLQAYHAVQWVTRAARTNLPATPDDSHSNLGWEPRLHGLVSHDLIASDGCMYRCALRVDAMTLFVAKNSEMTSQFKLDGRVDADSESWIDDTLTDLGLNRAGDIALPYDIPTHPSQPAGDIPALRIGPLSPNWHAGSRPPTTSSRSSNPGSPISGRGPARSGAGRITSTLRHCCRSEGVIPRGPPQSGSA
jgi:hypothetical protein